MSKRDSILITGGCGFIGTNLIKHLIYKYPDYKIYNLDSLTYSGNQANLKSEENNSNYKFIKGDITDSKFIMDLFIQYKFSKVMWFVFVIFYTKRKSNFYVFRDFKEDKLFIFRKFLSMNNY